MPCRTFTRPLRRVSPAHLASHTHRLIRRGGAGFRLSSLTCRPWRCVINADLIAFADRWNSNSTVAGTANGVPAPEKGTVEALLTVLARVSGARTVVEIGTGAGGTGSALLAGLADGGTLTSIDADPGVQRTARDCLTAAGGERAQVRLIAGGAREVLPRLTDGAYDLIVVNQIDEDAPTYLENALRLLRVGGMLILTNATRGGSAIDPANRGPADSAARETLRSAGDSEQLACTLLPVAGGVLLAVRQD